MIIKQARTYSRMLMARAAGVMILLPLLAYKAPAWEDPLGIIYPVAYLAKDDSEKSIFTVFYWNSYVGSSEGEDTRLRKMYVTRFNADGTLIVPEHIRTFSTPCRNDHLGFIFGGEVGPYAGVSEFLQADNESYIISRMVFADGEVSREALVKKQKMMITPGFRIVERFCAFRLFNAGRGDSLAAEVRYKLEPMTGKTKEIYIKTTPDTSYYELTSALLIDSKILIIGLPLSVSIDKRRGAVIHLLNPQKLAADANYIEPEISIMNDMLSVDLGFTRSVQSKLLKYNKDIALIVWVENMRIPWDIKDENVSEKSNMYISSINIKDKTVETYQLQHIDKQAIHYISAEIIENMMMIAYGKNAEGTELSDIHVDFIKIEQKPAGTLSYMASNRHVLKLQDVQTLEEKAEEKPKSK